MSIYRFDYIDLFFIAQVDERGPELFFRTIRKHVYYYCMSFSYEFRTLGSENSYDSGTQPRISEHGDKKTGEAEAGIIEGREESSIRFSP